MVDNDTVAEKCGNFTFFAKTDRKKKCEYGICLVF